jgi:cell division protein FtsB
MKIVVAAGFLVLCHTFAGERGLPALLQSRHDATILQARIDALKADNAALAAEARALRTDPATIEAVARRTLGLARADEIVFCLLD